MPRVDIGDNKGKISFALGDRVLGFLFTGDFKRSLCFSCTVNFSLISERNWRTFDQWLKTFGTVWTWPFMGRMARSI